MLATGESLTDQSGSVGRAMSIDRFWVGAAVTSRAPHRPVRDPFGHTVSRQSVH